MKTITVSGLKQTFATLGYAWSKTAPNLIGIRTSLNVPDVFNDLFVCVWVQAAMPLGIQGKVLQQQQWLNRHLYRGANGLPLKEDGQAGANTTAALESYNATVGTERIKTWVFTSLPGLFYLLTPLEGGAAVAAPGQWKKVWKLGLHQQKTNFRALVERATNGIGFYRDNDRDQFAEAVGKISTEHIGLNCHRSNVVGRTTRIANWSAGCQVFQQKSDHDELLSICESFEGAGFAYEKENGKEYDYTLLLENQLA